ncbi:tRNA 2-thiouridine(34) synthase MnmA [Coxiella endosymbiont of Amblyomma americanum]|uniref:tRNA 2-thiouridine(34) synthase MnmA n=1 Tax=Coxiella endosymbiont of Amblyomma americanum TaxID=325775 RepID=UPI00057CF2D0|nr:tRNA 2-thiouridine(34) synthase MnmA [Coxiella endosymbiont of Amblyomma americanum]AJC50601.1 tRNA 2-thiouridylase [Coxiella endosymbiont of Amblyomma americanum]AUJ58931.1 tRNA(5-methylaminomethyl-2-thiouridine)-methyltransferase [Coxiella-like endosymbiont of Amblyomma americanum]
MLNVKKNHVVAIGLSGGVDSSVAAFTMKKLGCKVFGLFMKNWEFDIADPVCTVEKDLSDAKAVAGYIGMPLYTINFSREYWDNVFQICLDEFSKGRTPNPDVLCNKEIKFKFLLKYAKKMGADFLATGHYANLQKKNGYFKLLKAHDEHKDQSYFLYLLNQYQLSHSFFPLSNYKKSDVRKIAKQAGLTVHAKKNSTGICFIGERRFKTLLSEFLLAKSGNMETTEGKIVGKHDGIMFYTIGQRRGLYIGGRSDSNFQPWYVVDKDVKRNALIVGQGHDHPLLYTTELVCSNVHWIQGTPPRLLPFFCKAKTRYRQVDQLCSIALLTKDLYRVKFRHPQWAITPGQSVVFYLGNECLGGGIIEKQLKNN